MFLWEQIGGWVFAHLGGIGFTEENFIAFQDGYNKYGFWIVFTCGFTPLPYKVCTITAGVAGIFFPGFLIASALSRSARFFLVAGLFGPLHRKILQLAVAGIRNNAHRRLRCIKAAASLIC
jgi:membrane protein YqaA with SNARE-associated domain